MQYQLVEMRLFIVVTCILRCMFDTNAFNLTKHCMSLSECPYRNKQEMQKTFSFRESLILLKINLFSSIKMEWARLERGGQRFI